MPRKILQKFMPDHDDVVNQPSLKWLGPLLRDPRLWRLNRSSVAGAFLIGVFVAFLPIPMQMLVAALLAILCHVNLAISISLVWITNPITMGPLFYFCYRIGAWILKKPDVPFHFEATLEWFTQSISFTVWPLLLGCIVVGGITSLISFAMVRVLWRVGVLHRLRERRERHKKQ
ncbi:MAG: DUF2062 domain-containing protein [Mariprofundales bacterium]